MSTAGSSKCASLPVEVSAQELFDASPDGLVVASRSGIVLAVNDALLELLHYQREELIGQSVDVLVPPAVRDRHRVHRDAFTASPATRGMGAGLDLHAVTARGDLVAVDVMLGPLPSAGEGAVLAALRDVRARRSREADWEHRALHDPLTGLANRSLVMDRLQQAALRAARSDGGFAVFFLDLEGFKAVNDRFGHAAGDEVLTVTARRLQAETRLSDTVGRVGGDEFVVIVEEPGGVPDMTGYVQRLRSALSAPMSVAGRELSVGCSVGCASGGGKDDWSQLLREADLRMYDDKATRRRVIQPDASGQRDSRRGP